MVIGKLYSAWSSLTSALLPDDTDQKSSKSPEKLGEFKLQPHYDETYDSKVDKSFVQQYSANVQLLANQMEAKNMAKYNYAEIEIETGVVIPAVDRRRKKSSQALTLLRSMKPGDSIKLPSFTAYAYISKVAKKNGINIVMRRGKDDSVRVWRVKK